MNFSEYEHYSPTHDAMMVRVSVPDQNGREYWTLVKADGAGYRKRRSDAVELCCEAIAIGCDPGEVRCS